MVRACKPPAREPGRSWLARRSTMAASTPASASSPASISPVGPPPTMSTACSVTGSTPPTFGLGSVILRQEGGLAASLPLCVTLEMRGAGGAAPFLLSPVELVEYGHQQTRCSVLRDGSASQQRREDVWRLAAPHVPDLGGHTSQDSQPGRIVGRSSIVSPGHENAAAISSARSWESTSITKKPARCSLLSA